MNRSRGINSYYTTYIYYVSVIKFVSKNHQNHNTSSFQLLLNSYQLIIAQNHAKTFNFDEISFLFFHGIRWWLLLGDPCC